MNRRECLQWLAAMTLAPFGLGCKPEPPQTGWPVMIRVERTSLRPVIMPYDRKSKTWRLAEGTASNGCSIQESDAIDGPFVDVPRKQCNGFTVFPVCARYFRVNSRCG